ncbi:MAG: hypothetical protein AB7O97_20205 [Planctomycetota bacterium]
MRADTDGMRPSMGVEIEHVLFAHGRPAGAKTMLPHRLVLHASSVLPCLPRFGRGGLFTPQGLIYHEMHRLLEVASWPAFDLPSVLRLEDAALLQARALFLEIQPWPRHHMVCCPDDASGTPLQLLHEPAPDVHASRSVGTHLNLLVPSGARRGLDTAIALAVALTEVTGPGGFVRRQSGELEFWRDPRSAHVCHRTATCAHDALRPVIKTTDDQRRLQIVAHGYAASRRDRTIRYGLFLLLGCHLASGRVGPAYRVDDVAAALRAAPDQPFRVVRNRRAVELTRRGLLRRLLDELLAPAAAAPLGQRAQCDAAVELANRVLDLQEQGAAAGEIARSVPLSWAIKQHAFDTTLRAAGGALPLAHGPRPAAPPSDAIAALLRQCAVLAVLEACALHDDVRRALLRTVDPADWRFDDSYGRDPEAVAAVRERRLPSGAIAPSAEIVAALRHGGTALPPDDTRDEPAQDPLAADAIVAADWDGVKRYRRPPPPPTRRRRPADAALVEELFSQHEAAVPDERDGTDAAASAADPTATAAALPPAPARAARRESLLAEARAMIERIMRQRRRD